MTLRPTVRRTVLLIHVATSVGWLGALAGYLVLDITTTVGTGTTTVRAAYVAMNILVRYAIVPLALASVLVGVINALGTHWGLFRHYWVLIKLLLTLVATGVLLLKVQDVGYLATVATTSPDPRPLSSTLEHSVGGMVVLVTALVLSVFKPRGLTRYGWRKQRGGQLRVDGS